MSPLVFQVFLKIILKQSVKHKNYHFKLKIKITQTHNPYNFLKIKKKSQWKEQKLAPGGRSNILVCPGYSPSQGDHLYKEGFTLIQVKETCGVVFPLMRYSTLLFQNFAL